MTFEVILSTAFGVDSKIQMGENVEMLREANKLFQIPQVVRQLARLPFGNLLFSLLSRVSGVKMNYMQGVAEEIIKSRRQHGLTGRKDLLELMMTANDETTVEGVSRLTDDEVVAQCVGYEVRNIQQHAEFYTIPLGCESGSSRQAEVRDQ